MLRSYEGVFDFPAGISENHLAKFTREAKEIIAQQLLQLKQFGIISYNPQKDTPQITLLQNRMYADSFIINLENYFKRKQLFEKRIKAIIKYVEKTVDCRSRLIAAYFNDTVIKPCGICDNCINQQTVVVDKKEFETISQHIFNLTGNNKITIQELLNNSKHIKKEKLWKVFNFLSAEKKIFVSREGEVKTNNEV